MCVYMFHVYTVCATMYSNPSGTAEHPGTCRLAGEKRWRQMGRQLRSNMAHVRAEAAIAKMTQLSSQEEEITQAREWEGDV